MYRYFSKKVALMKIAVVLSGCGSLDGAEISESVLTLLELYKHKIDVQTFAPDIEQTQVINHYESDIYSNTENRNVLIESNRITGGTTQPLDKLKPEDFNALIIPGGYGVAKNLSNIFQLHGKGTAIPQMANVIKSFWENKKPIGSICFAPTLIAATLKGITVPSLTLGKENELLETFEAKEVLCSVDDIVIDSVNKLITTPAFMYRDANIYDISIGISKLIQQVINMAKNI